jgi:hypothetical protein
MAARRKGEIHAKDLRGFKYFQMLGPLLQRLAPAGAERDRAGNRSLHFHDYAALFLLYFFSPVLTSLRGIQQASTLEKVQKQLGLRRTSLGSLSEAAHVFDPQLLHEIIAELADRVGRGQAPRRRAELAGLVAVDGSLLPALPKMIWAAWQDDTHRAAKHHLAFDVIREAPRAATITAGNGSERQQLRQICEPGATYVIDRGYADYSLFAEMAERGSFFVARLQENAVYEVIEERRLSEADRAAGVVRDVLIRRLGTDKHNPLLASPYRVVIVEPPEQTTRQGQSLPLVLVTNRLDWSAELIALAYRYRWTVELFFRWLKCILGCRHLLHTSEQGVTLQVYTALIASLLISLWAERPPTKRTYEMVCFYLSGWASQAEFVNHLETLRSKDPPSNS